MIDSQRIESDARRAAFVALIRRVDGVQGGFYSEADVREVAAFDRLRLVLIRFGCGRCLAPAQDALHIGACVTKGGDYVRDYSKPHGQDVPS